MEGHGREVEDSARVEVKAAREEPQKEREGEANRARVKRRA